MPNWWLQWAERIAPILADWWLRSRAVSGDGPPALGDRPAEPDPGLPAEPLPNAPIDEFRDRS